MIVSNENKKEIFYNFINSALAGGLVFLGSLTSGSITWQGVGAGILAGGIVMLTKFKHYWEAERPKYSRTSLFSFV